MPKRSFQIPDAVYLEKLLTKVGSEFEPESVPVHPEDYARPLNCYPNVDEKVRRDGGRPHYGWSIHKTNLLYEAERHAVWENEDGELVDVTPYESGVNEIQFVSDDNWVYTGKAVDNIRVNRTQNPLVDDFILLAEAVSQAFAYGSRLDGNEHTIPQPALVVAESYQKLKDDLLEYIRLGGQPYSVCYCGLRRTYRNCHGSQLQEGIKMVMDKLHSLLGSPI
ncbi:hypothetical protein FNT36_24850 [Hymenobacter setariae]|uniref:SEC-C domain-containing protein n=1 Tax=Hymenobacter setariae TaxID=2594794 RepID=A0A558BJT0_9BACT|nr:hypothetical protein [Hymenobacter setariae]TVT36745.1 hypothetical protein FNT36_24850 [Hymenobacter setariae]